MMKEMVYWSVDMGEPEAELEAIKENRLRYAAATLHSVVSEEPTVFIIIALGAPVLTEKNT